MSDEHKAALAAGRAESRAVDDYLSALAEAKPKRGRRRTPESIQKQLTRIEEELPGAKPVRKLHLVQKRLELNEELEALRNPIDPAQFQKEFIRIAKSYSDRQGISYAAWREVGVPDTVLKQAGISKDS